MTVVIDAGAGALLDVAVQVLNRTDLPKAVLIGGLAVTIRVARPNTPYRATADVDLVTDDDSPTLVEILTQVEASTEAVMIDGIKEDVIPTASVRDDDLDGIEDGPRLFVASHRWAFDTATTVDVAIASSSAKAQTIRVATTGALVAAKSHAVGFARSQRRSTKHGSDLLDVYRLIDLNDPAEIAQSIRAAPGRIGPVVAQVIQSKILGGPGKAAALMTPADSPLIDADELVDTMEAFLGYLEG